MIIALGIIAYLICGLAIFLYILRYSKVFDGEEGAAAGLCLMVWPFVLLVGFVAVFIIPPAQRLVEQVKDAREQEEERLKRRAEEDKPT